MTGRRLTGPTICTGPGDSSPPEATPWDELTGEVDALRERVEDLERQLGEVEAERDRLARILAVERGDVAMAPDGWGHGFAYAWRRQAGESRLIVDRASGGSWSWTTRTLNATVSGHADTALEAMEAAEAALAEIDP
jgi:hypothetical protein